MKILEQTMIKIITVYYIEIQLGCTTNIPYIYINFNITYILKNFFFRDELLVRHRGEPSIYAPAVIMARLVYAILHNTREVFTICTFVRVHLLLLFIFSFFYNTIFNYNASNMTICLHGVHAYICHFL